MIGLNEKTVYLIFQLIRCALTDGRLSDADRECLTEEMLADILTVSHKQDLAHLVGVGLQKNGLPDKESPSYEPFQLLQIKAVYRYEQLNFEYNRLCEVLESLEVPFLPLKGSVIRQLYPEPWMRTSCDIDILVPEAQLKKAADYLITHCGYSLAGKTTHDISVMAPGGQHIELHYQLIEEDWVAAANEMLKQVWEHTAPKEGFSFWQEMTDEMFYYYHIAHMAKHYEHGGCGLRPFVDLWLLDRMPGADKDRRDRFLEKGNLLRFANAMRQLVRVWMDGEPLDWITEQMQEFIVAGGAYGNRRNYIAMQQQKRGGRFGYVFSKIILPYDVLKTHYCILYKHPWLTPVMQVRRWCKLLFCGHMDRVARDVRYNGSVSKSQAEELKQLLQDIGL